MQNQACVMLQVCHAMLDDTLSSNEEARSGHRTPFLYLLQKWLLLGLHNDIQINSSSANPRKLPPKSVARNNLVDSSAETGGDLST
eukprot:6767806-Pyramimonas_sp.AAC.1